MKNDKIPSVLRYLLFLKWMRFSQVVRASNSECRSRNCPGFGPCILRHSGIWERQMKQCWIKHIDFFPTSDLKEASYFVCFVTLIEHLQIKLWSILKNVFCKTCSRIQICIHQRFRILQSSLSRKIPQSGDCTLLQGLLKMKLSSGKLQF
jgi:hypothetical protein